MNTDKTATITMIITNIVIWSLISIVLFFFGMIYVNAETDTNRYRYTMDNNFNNKEVQWNTNTTMTWKGNNKNWGLEYQITQTIGNTYRAEANVYLSEICNNCSAAQAENYIQLYRITNASNIKNVNITKYIQYYNPNTQEHIINLKINFTYTATSSNYIDLDFITDQLDFKSYGYSSGYVDRIKIELVSNATNDILNDINNDTYSIDGNTYKILQEQFNIQNLMRTYINNNYDQLDNQFDLLNEVLNGTYTISDIDGMTQYISMVSGENRLDLKLGQSDVDFDFTIGARDLGTGMDFIWTQISNIRIGNQKIMALITMALLLMLCKQALGRKN